MSKRHKSRIKGNHPAGRPRAGAWIYTSIAALVILGIIALNRTKTSPGTNAARSRLLGQTNGLSDASNERDLRREQLEMVEKLVSQFPTNDDAVYLAGLIHEDQGNTDQAMKFWTQSIELDATRADAHESLGQALLLRDDYAGAEKHFRQALAIDTNSANARFRLAKTLSQQGQLPEALIALEQAGTLSPEGYRLMGEICQQLNQPQRARTNYEAALRLKPDFPEACYGLAQTLAQLGEAEKGRAYMEESSVLRKTGEEQARRVRSNFDSLANTRQSVARTHTDVGRVYMVLGNKGKAEELWLRAATLDPRNVLCRLQLAVLYQQTRRDVDAVRLYEEAAKLDPMDGLTQLNLGRVCMRLRQVDRAARAFAEVIQLEPKRPEGYSALAQLYLQTRNNASEAERLAGIAAELEPVAPYFALLSQVRVQNGDQSGALSAINRAIELQPANPQWVQLRETILATKR